MTPEYQFIQELYFRRLQRRMVKEINHLTSISRDWPPGEWSKAMGAIVDSYPSDFRRWLPTRRGMAL